MKTFGLIGYPLGHSFSKKYFIEKFKNENLEDHQYINFEIDSIARFPSIFDQFESISGLNCTIPYKQQIIPFLSEIDPEAKEIGAVNTIKMLNTDQGLRLKGYNTDSIGFEKSLTPLLQKNHKKALVLGTGGASKAIRFVLRKLGITYLSATTKNEISENEIHYNDLTAQIIKEHLVIINATPLGTAPNIDRCPEIPYEALCSDHLLYDLVYNPEVTLFLEKGAKNGAQTKNGIEMLHEQAIASWKIWNSK